MCLLYFSLRSKWRYEVHAVTLGPQVARDLKQFVQEAQPWQNEMGMSWEWDGDRASDRGGYCSYPQMLYNGISHWKGWFWGTPLWLGKPPYCCGSLKNSCRAVFHFGRELLGGVSTRSQTYRIWKNRNNLKHMKQIHILIIPNILFMFIYIYIYCYVH